MMKETVLVIDFGGQYNQLIARRVRDLNVYCELIPCGTPLEKIKAKNPIGIIFTGGPNSVFGADALKVDEGIYTLGVPVLGICYGAQLIAHQLGGKVRSAAVGEYGQVKAVYKKSVIFDGLPEEGVCWMSHTDSVSELPDGFEITAFTADCPVAAMQNTQKRIYAVQFHPEVAHTQNGTLMLKNFLYKACGASGDWTMKDFVARKVAEIREKVGDKKVLCAMSGGVDSAVAATLVHRAVGDRLTCVYVDHGLMRKNETEEVRQVFKDGLGMNLILADAEELFLRKLAGVTDPESKRKIIGREFITVFEREAEKIGKVDYLVQGTIYPDVIESGSGDSAVIKSHHNVGGLPDVVDFEEIIEPLRDLFKDEVRAVGFELGLPEQVVMRQPFPGPGLGIRVIGEITKEKLETLREADFIYREEIAKAGLSGQIWQYFAVLTDTRSVGVMGDMRTYDYTVALRAVLSVDAMTADWAKIPYEVLGAVSSRIVNEVRNVNRVVYDITSKPPATIEWE
ncbi:MAG TPA: glutamine-hydrolyzing GMP synthase [Candidatus Faecicola pullistercoris]|nr:glutamine-hydrolyzing GMP synthase [Candidatus Faecicola pullistercoris]